jgi:hypothetical protein
VNRITRKLPRIRIACLLLLISLLIACTSQSRAEPSAAQNLNDYSRKGQYLALVKTYSALSEAEKNQPSALYVAGFAWMRLHRPEKAKPLFQAAIKSDFDGYPGWTSAKTYLEEINSIERDTPPFFADVSDGSQTKIHAYSKQTAWTAPVLRALPGFVKRATQIFGDEVPAINFYFFEDRTAFNDFYKNIFGLNVPTAWQDGTGNANIVVFCERNKDGKMIMTPGSDLAIGDVLHEYGHAMCNTIFGDGYLEQVPKWLDEGTADAVAAPYFVALFQNYNERLVAAAAAGQAPPTYEQMSRELYKDPNLRYALASMMVQEIVKEKDITVLRKIIDRARQLQDFERAIKDTTGSSSSEFHRRVVKRYWKNGKVE